MAHLGKKVGQRIYVHRERVCELEPAGADLVHRAKCLIEQQRTGVVFNVVRIEAPKEEVAFLYYPGLGVHPFPPLASSWRVHIPSALVTHRRYADSLNPPILHRTELLLTDDDEVRQACAALTRACETVGLFENPSTIGFQRDWYELIESKGYELSGFELVPLGNTMDEASDAPAVAQDASGIVRRHLTALSRTTLSAPVQCLIRDDLLRQETSFFDYGCGKGDDLATLQAAGFRVSGWDPYFRASEARIAADVVNLGFVINVIEDREERIAALQRAYSLAGKVLAVSAMVTSREPGYGRSFGDGIVTSRHTFQKFFTQAELQQFIESVLDEDAYPAAPGVFYAFADRSCEQSYLLRRSSNRSRVARSRLPQITHVRAAGAQRPPRRPRSETPEAAAYLSSLWDICLERGRTPEAEEVPDPAQAKRLFGSLKRALDICLTRNDADTFGRAVAGRRDDILVMLALRAFERRRKFGHVDADFARDIRSFFGNLREAESEAHKLLFSVQSKGAIGSACEEAASLGLGWLQKSHSLQLHTSLIERLPPVLRVYVGCATAMAGDLASFDVIKLHIESGKVTLMKFDDFTEKPLPALQIRVKVRLRDQALDVFEYSEDFQPTVLFRKSRFINEEFPHYAEQVEFEEALEGLQLFDLSGYGPSEAEFVKKLRVGRWEIEKFKLRRSTDLPDLSEKCGRVFTYRDLIECGETWDAQRPDNAPRSADSYNALCDLSTNVLDPVIEYFGGIRLTYGFATPALTKHISGRISPGLDQHSSCERTRTGKAICSRLGAAVDFIVEYEDMREVAKWIVENCRFDRMYFYGVDRPLHVSIGPQESRAIYEMAVHGGRRVPRRITF